MKCAIYDYETLGQDTTTLPVVSLAILTFDTDRFNADPYTFSELVDSCIEFKFNVDEQVTKYGKKVDKNTLDWWANQPKELRDAQLTPSPSDISITKIYGIFNELSSYVKRIYTRGNTFDPMITEAIMKDIGKPSPYDWWVIRDTRSMIEGMSYGSDLNNKFMVDGLSDKFIAHDPRHDIAMDVMRMQTLAQAIT